MAAGPYCKHVNRQAQGLGKKSHCTSSLLGIPPEFVFFTTSLWPAGCGTSWLARWQKIWMMTLHLAQWACEIRIWAQPKATKSIRFFAWPQNLQIKEALLWFLQVLMEGIMFCGIVEFPLKIAFDLETTPYIYFELPGDLSARGPATSICAPQSSHIRKQVWCRAS